MRRAPAKDPVVREARKLVREWKDAAPDMVARFRSNGQGAEHFARMAALARAVEEELAYVNGCEWTAGDDERFPTEDEYNA